MDYTDPSQATNWLMYAEWGAALIAFAFAFFFFWSSVVIVGGNEIALLERKYVGNPLPEGRIFAQKGQVGLQADYLSPGKAYTLIPYLYSVTKVPFINVSKGQVGIVESLDGAPVPPGQIFARQVSGHNFFQDGGAFLRNNGQKGVQVQVLPPGVYKINTKLFHVEIVDAVQIESGSIGVVTSQDGKPIPTGRLLAGRVAGHSSFQDGDAFLKAGGMKGPQIDLLLPGVYYINTKLFSVKKGVACIIDSGMIGQVDALDGAPLPPNEFVAQSVVNHEDFQDGATFLEKGGQRGPQLDVLKPGTYYINPYLFNVTTTKVTEVQRGQVAVVVSNIGKEPSLEVKQRLNQVGDSMPADASKETYVVPAGYRGIQEQVSGPGRYYLNTRAFTPYIIDTTNQTVDWDTDDAVDFDPLKIVSKDGFVISVSVKVIIRVRPDQAPFMVAKVGSLDNLIKNVIHPMIDSSFRNQASTTEAMGFMQNRKEEQTRAEEYVRHELEKYHVECVSVLICQIVLPQELMDTQTKKIIAEQQLPQYQAQEISEEGRINVEKKRATASAQQSVVNAEVAVQVANQKKLEMVTLAEGESQSTILRGQGQASQIAAIGEANATAYDKQQKAVGAQNLMIMRVVETLKDSTIKLVPEILSIGGNAENGLSGMLTKLLAANAAPQLTKGSK